MPKQKSPEQYKQELVEKNPHLIVLEDYKGANTKILHKCIYCGKEWKVYPSNALKGCRCKSCLQTKSHEQYVEELKKVNPDIEILDTYTGTREENTFRCLICGYVWTVTPSNPLRGKGCRKCGNKRISKALRRTKDEYSDELNKVLPNLKVLEYPKDTYDLNVKVECLECGHIWTTYKHTLLQGHGCPICSRKGTRVSEDDFWERVHENTPEAIILSSYSKGSDYYRCKCRNCGHEWSASGSNLMQGKSGCRECYRANKRLSEEEVLQRIDNEHNGLIIPLEHYIDGQTKILFKCMVCGTEWYAKPRNIMNGIGCKICNTSKGERRIFNFLSRNNIDNILGKYFDDLIGLGGGVLSYDFYLPDYNTLIEYQGQQHEKAFEWSGGEEHFKKQQEHDKRKKEYALSHGYNFLEIWYYDFDNIEKILTNYLNLESVETIMDV